MFQSSLVSASLSLLLLGCGHFAGQSVVVPTPAVSLNQDGILNEVSSKVIPESKVEAIEKLEERQTRQDVIASLPTVISIRLLDDTLDLSEWQVNEGNIELSTRNDATKPLVVQIIRTELAPEEIVIKDGQVDSTQLGVEVFSQLSKQPIKPGEQETLLTSLKPGAYKVVITTAEQDQLIDFAELLVVGVV